MELFLNYKLVLLAEEFPNSNDDRGGLRTRRKPLPDEQMYLLNVVFKWKRFSV